MENFFEKVTQIFSSKLKKQCVTKAMRSSNFTSYLKKKYYYVTRVTCNALPPTLKTSVSCLQSSVVVGVSWSGAAWVLPALGSYSSLREPWMPTCTVTYWSRDGSPPFGDWAAGQFSSMITMTTLLKKLRVKVMDWPSIQRITKGIAQIH